MKEVKRIEIVIDAAHTPELIRLIKSVHATGYTLIRDVQGSGDRGERAGDELSNVYRNCYVLVAADSETADRMIQTVRPLLEHYGGMCLISDANWLKH